MVGECFAYTIWDNILVDRYIRQVESGENMKQNTVYKVLEAERVSVYHYHGSWFEYEWRMVLRDTLSGEVIEGKYDTWDDYKILKGKYVKLSLLSDTFVVT